MASREFQQWYEKFTSTGDICPIRLGISRDQLRAIFGEPDDVGGTSRKRRDPRIWVYDGLEFHFDHTVGYELCLIYSDAAGHVEISIPRRPPSTPRRVDAG